MLYMFDHNGGHCNAQCGVANVVKGETYSVPTLPSVDSCWLRNVFDQRDHIAKSGLQQ